MRRTWKRCAGLLVGTVVGCTALTGCGGKTDRAGATTQSGAPTAPAAPPIDPHVQAMADAQAKGREADAKKTAEAMQKKHTP